MGKKRSRGKKCADIKDNESLSKSSKSVQESTLSKDHDKFLLEAETASKVTPNKESSATLNSEVKIVEKEVVKIVEKVVPDPLLVKQVKQLQKENQYLNDQLETVRTQPSSEIQPDSKMAEELNTYKEVLQNTESLLRNLQKSVEEEEEQFLKKVRSRDEQIRQLKDENKKLLLQLDVKSYSESVNLDENEGDLSVLRTALKNEEELNVSLKQKCSQLQNELMELKGRSNGVPNGPSENEGSLTHTDTTSTASLDAVSISSRSEDDLAKNKKKKNFFSKLIRKSPSKEVKASPIAE